MRRRGEKKSNIGLIVAIVLLLGIIGSGLLYIYSADKFERTPPGIKISKSSYWNAQDSLEITLLDNYGLKSYLVTLSDSNKEITVATESDLNNIKKRILQVKYPLGHLDKKAKILRLRVTATDKSKWNFLKGNITEKEISLKIDHKRPNINILSNSYSITRGGSALVIFQARDDDGLAQLYIEAGGRLYNVQPYKKEGYFVSLIAWPFKEEDFQAKIFAKDRAGNTRSIEIPYYLKGKSYKTSTIKASDAFIDGKISDLAELDNKYIKDSRLEKLKAVNETMRIDNEKLIHQYTTNLSNELLTSWNIGKFYPLRNGQKVASFGDHRYYYYDDKNNIISESYHLGYDMASVKMAPIIASNKGKVVFANFNGIYGNMPIIDHGLGLYTLYGHCSSLEVKEGDEVKEGQVIANTGVTGLALGDHLHFGILVQGIEVRPVEWLDSKWIRDNISKIFKDADLIMGVSTEQNNTKQQ